MDIQLTVNGQEKTIECQPGDTLLRVLRREGYFSVRFGSDSGETGAAAILLDGDLISSDILLAAQADGHAIETAEGLSQGLDLHPIQQAFIRAGAIQSGYSTPAMLLAAKALLQGNPDPSEAQIREAISGVLDRETGYVKPVQAIQAAAAMMRGEEPDFPVAECTYPQLTMTLDWDWKGMIFHRAKAVWVFTLGAIRRRRCDPTYRAGSIKDHFGYS